MEKSDSEVLSIGPEIPMYKPQLYTFLIRGNNNQTNNSNNKKDYAEHEDHTNKNTAKLPAKHNDLDKKKLNNYNTKTQIKNHRNKDASNRGNKTAKQCSS